MKLRNIAAGPRGVYTCTGMVTLGPGEEREVELSDGERDNLAPYFAVIGGDTFGRVGRIREIIGSLTGEDFTGGGKPKVSAINDLMDDGEPVTAGERDAIWADMLVKAED